MVVVEDTVATHEARRGVESIAGLGFVAQFMCVPRSVGKILQRCTVVCASSKNWQAMMNTDRELVDLQGVVHRTASRFRDVWDENV